MPLQAVCEENGGEGSVVWGDTIKCPDEIYIDEDDENEDTEKNERDAAGIFLIVQDRLFSGAVDWTRLHSGYVVLVSQDVDGVKHVELRKPAKAERFLILKNYIKDYPRA